MDRDRHVGEHRLGPRGGDVDEPGAVGERIFQVPEAALYLARLDLEIADRGAEAGIPVHKALVAIEQPFLVRIDEYLEHGLREALVHRERSEEHTSELQSL